MSQDSLMELLASQRFQSDEQGWGTRLWVAAFFPLIKHRGSGPTELYVQKKEEGFQEEAVEGKVRSLGDNYFYGQMSDISYNSVGVVGRRIPGFMETGEQTSYGAVSLEEMRRALDTLPTFIQDLRGIDLEVAASAIGIYAESYRH